MGEIIAKIIQGKIALVDESMRRLSGAPMSPEEGAFLARSLLSCAAALTLNAIPHGNAIIADLHFPVLKWSVTTQTESKTPVVIFSIPPGIDLTFQITQQIEKELGSAMVSHSQGHPPPEKGADKVH